MTTTAEDNLFGHFIDAPILDGLEQLKPGDRLVISPAKSLLYLGFGRIQPQMRYRNIMTNEVSDWEDPRENNLGPAAMTQAQLNFWLKQAHS